MRYDDVFAGIRSLIFACLNAFFAGFSKRTGSGCGPPMEYDIQLREMMASSARPRIHRIHTFIFKPSQA